MWLFDKLSLLELQIFAQYEARLCTRWKFLPMQRGSGGYKQWFESLASEDVVWRCPWYDLPDMTSCNMNFLRVMLTGLSKITFYIPR